MNYETSTITLVSYLICCYQSLPTQSSISGSAKCEALQEATLRYAPSLLTHIRLGWNVLRVTNTLAQYKILDQGGIYCKRQRHQLIAKFYTREEFTARDKDTSLLQIFIIGKKLLKETHQLIAKYQARLRVTESDQHTNLLQFFISRQKLLKVTNTLAYYKIINECGSY